MLKKILFTVISLLIASFGVTAQDMKEALKQYVDNIESIEDARFWLESMSQIQNIKITSADKKEAKENNDYNNDEASTPFIIPTDVNGDSINEKFADYLNNKTFYQYFIPPHSQISLHYYPSEFNDILGIPLPNSNNPAHVVVHKIYYGNGMIEEPHTRYSLDQTYIIGNAKFIDSLEVEVIMNYPTNIEHISLSKKNPTFNKGDNITQLSSMKGCEADIRLSQDVFNNLITIQAKDKKGIVSDYISKSYSPYYSPVMSAYFQKMAKRSNIIIKNIDDSMYNSLDDLRKDIFDKFSSDIPEDDQDCMVWVQFKDTISQVDIYYATGMDSIKAFTTIINRDLQSKAPYYCVIDPNTYKYGIIDNSGNWVIEPQYNTLQPFDSLFFKGYKDLENANYQTYKLDVATKTLNQYKYYIGEIILNNYYLISESVDSVKVGIMDKNENIIIPISKEWIYSLDIFFAAIDTKAGLYDNTGKVLLPEIYSQLGVVGKYIYATKYEKGRRITTIFDTSLNQITKDNWDAQTKFSDHSDLVLIEDENKSLFYINKQGDVIIAPSSKYIFSEEFWSGSTIVYSEDSDDVKKYGYINEQGETIIEPQYDYALPFQGDYAYVEKDGKAMLIDKNNRIYKTLPLTLGSWGYVLDSNPAYTQYRLEDDRIFDGYGNYVKDM